MKTITLPPGTVRLAHDLEPFPSSIDDLAAVVLAVFPNAVQLIVDVRTGEMPAAPETCQVEIRRDSGTWDLLYNCPMRSRRLPAIR